MSAKSFYSSSRELLALVQGDRNPSPGPGGYSSRTDHRGTGNIGDAAAWTMSPRTNFAVPESNGPGPQAYTPRTLGSRSAAPTGQTMPAYSMSGEARFGSAATLGPGPSAYSSPSSIHKGTVVFGSAKQREDQRYYGEAHARHSFGRHSPGPAASKVVC